MWGSAETSDGPDGQDFVSASIGFYTSWASMPASVIYAALGLIFSLFFATSMSPQNHWVKVQVCFDRFRHAHLIWNFCVILPVIKHNLQEALPVQQNYRKVNIEKTWKKSSPILLFLFYIHGRPMRLRGCDEFAQFWACSALGYY